MITKTIVKDMNRQFMMVFIILISLSVSAAYAGKERISKEPVNPKATPETRQLYHTLYSLYGDKAVSGVVANIDWNIREAENVNKWTGRWPVINVFDFINIHASKDVNPKGWLNYADMTPVFKWHEAGGVVGMMWHWQVKATAGTP